jgi:DnaJ-class molecular chaperone
LELDSSAEEGDIKKAFRKLSVKYHPDKTRNKPELSARFPAIREAYDVLSNLEHRAVYDMGGFQMVREAQQSKLKKGPSMKGEIKVTLEAMYNGLDQRTAIQRKTICRYCADKSTPRCNQCNVQCAHETQIVNVQMGPFMVQQEQPVASRERCKNSNTNLLVQVERGMGEGDELTFPGMGEQQPKSVPGDVILSLKQETHAVFKRSGNDLRMKMTISLKEALLGWKRTINHLDGRQIEVEISGITSPMETIKVQDEGMPYRGDPTSKGHLYIKVYIDMPRETELQEHHKAWLQENFPGR